MNESRGSPENIISITKRKHSLNIMKLSSHEKLENLCNEKIYQDQFHTEIETFSTATTSS